MKGLILGALLLLAPIVTAAQEAAEEPTPAVPESAARERIQQRLRTLTEQLNLSEEQKAKIGPILEDEARQLRELRQNTSLAPAERRAKARQIFQTHREQIDQVLTPEQREKMKEIRKQRREEYRGRRRPPRPR